MASVDSYGSPANPQRLTTPQPNLPLPSERVRSIMETDSPLMRQAATRGKQYAHQRGLLNSSLAAQASEGSLLAHAFPIAQADTSAALEGRSLGIRRQQTDDAWSSGLLDYALNRDRLTSDDEYRNRQMELTDRINTQRLNLDRERFESDAVYREQQLAQERQLRQEQLGLDRELGTRRLDIDRELGTRRLDIDRELGTGRLDIDRELGTGRLDLDRERLTSDVDLRNRQMELTDRINTQRLNLDRERFESDAVYREQQLAQERQLRQEQLALDRELGTRRLDIDASVAGRGAQQSAWNTYAAMWSALLSNPNIDAATRGRYMESLRRFLDDMNEQMAELWNAPLGGG